jgi:lipoate-protein ligase A
VKSIRSRVANISEFLDASLGVVELRERILERIFSTRDRALIPSLHIGEDDWRRVRELHAQKYGTDAWNYGQNPPSNVQRSQRFPSGEIDVRLDVQENRIAGIRIFGDFMGRLDVAELEAMLLGLPFERDVILGALEAVNLNDYFGDVPRDEVVVLFHP